jgi:hypothetical protein
VDFQVEYPYAIVVVHSVLRALIAVTAKLVQMALILKLAQQEHALLNAVQAFWLIIVNASLLALLEPAQLAPIAKPIRIQVQVQILVQQIQPLQLLSQHLHQELSRSLIPLDLGC